MKRNWLKRILALFGCISFGLSTIIFPVCVLVLALDVIYIAVDLIVLTFLILFVTAQGGGCNRCDCNMPSGGSCDCDCSSSRGDYKSRERDELDNSHCGFLGWFPGPKAFYCCLKIITTGENPMYKKYYELSKKCFEEVNKLLNDKSVTNDSLDKLLENAKDVDSADRKRLRSKIVETIIEKKIIPLIAALAIKQNKSVKKVFGLQEMSKNQQQGALDFKNFHHGTQKLLYDAEKNNINQINRKESGDFPSEKEIKQPQTISQSTMYNFFPGEAAPNIIQIQQQDRITINKVSNKPKYSINVELNDKDREKLMIAWNSCWNSIKKHLGDIKNQRSLYKNLTQEEKKQKGNENGITIE